MKEHAISEVTEKLTDQFTIVKQKKFKTHNSLQSDITQDTNELSKSACVSKNSRKENAKRKRTSKGRKAQKHHQTGVR